MNGRTPGRHSRQMHGRPKASRHHKPKNKENRKIVRHTRNQNTIGFSFIFKIVINHNEQLFKDFSLIVVA